MKKAPAKMKKAAVKFTASLRKASADGKLKGKFKEAVDRAPVNMKKASAMKMKKMKDSAMTMKKAAMKLKKDSTMMMKKAAMKMKKVSAMKMKMKKK